MKPDYNRAERYGLVYNEYLKEYNRRYPNGGPSNSSDCGGVNGEGCGCWVCRSIAWGLDITSTECDTHICACDQESSVISTVIKVLVIIGVLAFINGRINDEYHKSTGGMYRLPEPSTEKHWLYK